MYPLKEPPSDSTTTFALRHDLRPGDLGTLISLHGTVYAQECGFDSTFEAHVARLLGELVTARTDRDQLWIAEWEGWPVGCISVVSRSQKDAELCWLLVDPSVRWLGLGRRLIHDAVVFCRRCGYEHVFLRNFRVFTAASRLFRSVGFVKVEERPSQCWGASVVEEWYALPLFSWCHTLAGEQAR